MALNREAPAVGVGSSEDGFTGSFTGIVAITPSRIIVAGFGPSQAESLVAHLCAFAVHDTGFSPSSAEVSGPGAAAAG